MTPSDCLERRARIAVIHDSAGGHVHTLARAVAEGAASEGADVRLRHVAELSQEMAIAAKQYWGRHRSEIEDQPDARLDDIEWADGIAFGTPTRIGNVSAQLKVTPHVVTPQGNREVGTFDHVRDAWAAVDRIDLQRIREAARGGAGRGRHREGRRAT